MFEPDAVLFPNLSGRIFFQDIIISGSSVRDITDFSPQHPLMNWREYPLNMIRTHLL